MNGRRRGDIVMDAGALMLAFVLFAAPLHLYGTGLRIKHIFGVAASALAIVFGLIVVAASGKLQS
jgi:hypothetical protein